MKTNDTYSMGRYEKIAWFNFAVVLLSVATYIVITLLLTGRIGITGAAAGAAASFALLGFTGFAPRLFVRQNIAPDSTHIPSVSSSRHTVGIVVFGALTVAIVIAIIRLFTILLGLPNGNSPMFAVATTLLIVLPLMLGGLLIVGVLFLLKRRHTHPSTEAIDRSTMRYGLFADTDMDEHDLAIHNHALKAGFGAFLGTYLSLFIGTFIVMLLEGHETLTIDLQFILVPMWLPFIVIVAVASIAKIIMYRRGGAS